VLDGIDVSHFEVGGILACGPRGYFINTIRPLSLCITVLSTCLTKPCHLCGARSIAKRAAKEGTIVPWVFRRAGRPIKSIRIAWTNASRTEGSPRIPQVRSPTMKIDADEGAA